MLRQWLSNYFILIKHLLTHYRKCIILLKRNIGELLPSHMYLNLKELARRVGAHQASLILSPIPIILFFTIEQGGPYDGIRFRRLILDTVPLLGLLYFGHPVSFLIARSIQMLKHDWSLLDCLLFVHMSPSRNISVRWWPCSHLMGLPVYKYMILRSRLHGIRKKNLRKLNLKAVWRRIKRSLTCKSSIIVIPTSCSFSSDFFNIERINLIKTTADKKLEIIVGRYTLMLSWNRESHPFFPSPPLICSMAKLITDQFKVSPISLVFLHTDNQNFLLFVEIKSHDQPRWGLHLGVTLHRKTRPSSLSSWLHWHHTSLGFCHGTICLSMIQIMLWQRSEMYRTRHTGYQDWHHHVQLTDLTWIIVWTAEEIFLSKWMKSP